MHIKKIYHVLSAGLQRCTKPAMMLNMGVDLCAEPTITQYYWPLAPCRIVKNLVPNLLIYAEGWQCCVRSAVAGKLRHSKHVRVASDCRSSEGSQDTTIVSAIGLLIMLMRETCKRKIADAL